MGLIQTLQGIFKRHGGWILTALSGGGFIATNILVAKEAPKAQRELSMAYMDKNWTKDPEEREDDLSFAEKLDIAGPIYLPAIITGAFSLACLFGAQIFNQKQQTALVAAYGLLLNEYAGYRKEVQKNVGPDLERELYISNRKNIALEKENKELQKEGKPQLYTFASLPGVIFESTPNHMNDVFYHMMWMMLQTGVISLYDLYNHTGIPESAYNVDDANEYGWDSYENEVSWGNPAVTFEMEDVVRDDGETIHVIEMDIPPYKLGLDYGGKDSSGDNLFNDYNWSRACMIARKSGDKDIQGLDETDLHFVHAF